MIKLKPKDEDRSSYFVDFKEEEVSIDNVTKTTVNYPEVYYSTQCSILLYEEVIKNEDEDDIILIKARLITVNPKDYITGYALNNLIFVSTPELKQILKVTQG